MAGFPKIASAHQRGASSAVVTVFDTVLSHHHGGSQPLYIYEENKQTPLDSLHSSCNVLI